MVTLKLIKLASSSNKFGKPMTLNSGYGNLPRGLETVWGATRGVGAGMFWWSNIDKMELIMYIEHSQNYSICTIWIYNDIPQRLFK